MEKFEKLKQMIAEVETDFVKFYDKGNSAAGTRIRKSMQDLKTLAQEIRIDVQDLKNSDSK